MEEISEVWMFVPETDERLAVSNYGRLEQVMRKRARRHTVRIYKDGSMKKLSCAFKTGEIGWYVCIDGEQRFFTREKLLALFKGIPLAVDTSGDASLVEHYEANYETWLKEKAEKDPKEAEPETQWKSPKGVPERWLPVEETGGRFAVSNYGHLKKVSRRILNGEGIVTESCDVPIHIIADYKTGDMGWYVHIRNQKIFLRRDDLVSLFPEDECDVDTSCDAECIRRREETGKPLDEFVSERKQSREEHSSSAAE